jgi:hypothetical protein
VNKDLIANGAIAAVLCTALFLIQVITATLRREPGGLMRAVRGVGIAFVASAFALATTKLVLAAVDDLCDGVVRFSTGAGIDGLGSRFALSVSLANMANPAAALLFALVVLAAVVVVWAALMMRKLLLIVAAVMTPLAFSGGAADVTRSWVRRWIEFTAALIASKLILVVILMVGLSVFEGAGMTGTGPGMQPAASQSGTQLATGAVLLLMAGFAPWIAIKMFHFAGDSLHAVHSQAAAARSGTQTVVAAPRKVSATMSTIGRTSGGGASVASYDAQRPVANRTAEPPGRPQDTGSNTTNGYSRTSPPAGTPGAPPPTAGAAANGASKSGSAFGATSTVGTAVMNGTAATARKPGDVAEGLAPNDEPTQRQPTRKL